MKEILTRGELDDFIARNRIETLRQRAGYTVRYMARFIDRPEIVHSSRSVDEQEIENSRLDLEFLMKRQAVELVATDREKDRAIKL